MMQDLFMRSPG